MVNYEINTSTGALNILHDKEHFKTNLSLLTRWSPFSSEAELLKQFDDIGSHGTKLIIYNLWFSDEGRMELDFDSDPEDIQISGGDIRENDAKVGWRSVNEQHIAKRLQYSLRAYVSILYLRVPETFSIILRGCPVEHHNIANDLKFPEFILYRPQSGGCVEGTVITTIGFLKEAPHVNIHGFNVYHKNRLILPYWQVVSYTSNSRGRGVVGVLEANFIEPTHNKQDFERTSLFQKLETRLKEMTWEYWDYHCTLIGYRPYKKPRASNSPQISSHSTPLKGIQPVVLNQSSAPVGGTEASPVAAACQSLNPSHTLVGNAGQSIPYPQVTTKHGSHKRKERRELEFENVKKHIGKGTGKSDGGHCLETEPVITTSNQLRDQEAINLMQENKKLHAKCLEYDKRRQELNHKVTKLTSEIGEFKREYDRLLAELQALDAIKEEKKM